MKKILEGKRYDTDTATHLYEWENFCGNLSDFNHMEESLYVTKSGTFFLYVAGGANTRYAEDCGKYRCGGESIIPVDEQEAFRWCQKRDAIHVIEERFSDMIQDA